MKSKFYIPKSNYRWIYCDEPVKITKASDGELYYCCSDSRAYYISEKELSNFKVCPKKMIEKRVANLKWWLQFYTE